MTSTNKFYGNFPGTHLRTQYQTPYLAFKSQQVIRDVLSRVTFLGVERPPLNHSEALEDLMGAWKPGKKLLPPRYAFNP